MCRNYYRIIFLLLLGITSIPFLYFSNIKTSDATQLKQINYQKSFEVNGVIESSECIPISLSYPVYIKQCYVKENSFVNKGQLLFVLDTEKMRNLASDYSFSDTKFLEQYYENDIYNIPSEIYASESGVIHDIIAYSGNIVMPDESLCVIDKNEDLMLKITVDQYDYPRIMVGDKIIFSPVIAPAREYSATVIDKTAIVRKITSIAGNKTVVDIFAEIDFCDDYITHGLQFAGTVINPKNKSILTLPYEYLNQDDNGEYVNIFSNGISVKKYVETGVEMENCIEIKTEIPPNAIFIKNDAKGKLLIERFD